MMLLFVLMGYSYATANWFITGMPLIPSYVFPEELFAKISQRGRLVFLKSCLFKRFGAEGTHVKHDVSTCVLQHLVSSNRHMVL